MPYITQNDLLDVMSEAELIQATDDAKSGLIDAAKVTAAIDAASADIDAYAGTRYTVPLQSSNKVKQLAKAIAVWYLEQRRRKIRKDTQTGYDAAMAFLKDLAAGKAVLDQPAGAPAQAAGDGVASTDKSPTVFTDDTLENF